MRTFFLVFRSRLAQTICEEAATTRQFALQYTVYDRPGVCSGDYMPCLRACPETYEYGTAARVVLCCFLTHQPRCAPLDALPAHTLRIAPGHDLRDEVRVSTPGLKRAGWERGGRGGKVGRGGGVIFVSRYLKPYSDESRNP